MKATHKGTAKALHILLNQCNMEFSQKNLDFYTGVAGREVKLSVYGSEGTHFSVQGYDEYLLALEDLTNITEIKPRVEIPKENTFWFTCGDNLIYKASLLECGLYKVSWEGDQTGHHDYSRGRISDNLNKSHGNWKIVDAPKKEMEPWSDEEIKRYLMNDNWLQFEHNDSQVSLLKPWLIRSNSVKFADSVDGNYNFTLKSIITQFKDEDGNAFTKETDR